MTFKKPTIFVGVFISLLSLIFSLFLAEYFVKKTNPQITYDFARARGLNIYEKGDKIPIVLQKNIKNYEHIGLTVEFTSKISTNSFGLRGDEISLEKPQNVKRILVLGDSMTFGWGVSNDQTFTSLLQKKLNELAKSKDSGTSYEILNAGFADGKTLDTYYLYLKETGLKFKPDIVILNLFPYNDYTDLSEMNWDEIDENGLPSKISSKTQIVKDGYLINIFSKNWMYEIPIIRNTHSGILLMSAMENKTPSLVKKIKSFLKLPQSAPKTISPNDVTYCISNLLEKYCPPLFLEEFEMSKKLILETKHIAEQSGAKFALTIVPWPDQIKLNKKELDGGEPVEDVNPQQKIRSYLNDEGIDYLDLLPDFAFEEIKKNFFELDGHFNKEGNEKVGELLFNFVTDKYPEELLQDK